MSDFPIGSVREQQIANMGYQTASKRPQCGNCRHADVSFVNPDSIYERESYRCKKGDFAITKTAICDFWGAK